MFPGFAWPSKKYTYPDGTQSVNRPKDGQTYHTLNPDGSLGATWQWDDFKEQWFNISSGKPTPQNTATFVPQPIQFFDPKDLDNFENIAIDWAFQEGFSVALKCECGSDAVGSPRHSNWCRKYDPAA